MKLLRYFERLNRMDTLIRLQATGSPKEFAQKLEISERTLYDYLLVLKSLGASIEYSFTSKTYFYSEKENFFIGFLK